MENIGKLFFSPDGLSSRDLMFYPYDPIRQSALWIKYDYLSLNDIIDQIFDFSQKQKVYFEALMTSIGSRPGTDIRFVEFLRWFALDSYTVSGIFEIIEIFKLGDRGQTALARGILSEYRGYLNL